LTEKTLELFEPPQAVSFSVSRQEREAQGSLKGRDSGVPFSCFFFCWHTKLPTIDRARCQSSAVSYADKRRKYILKRMDNL